MDTFGKVLIIRHRQNDVRCPQYGCFFRRGDAHHAADNLRWEGSGHVDDKVAPVSLGDAVDNFAGNGLDGILNGPHSFGAKRVCHDATQPCVTRIVG